MYRIEQMAKDSLKEIHEHTTLCVNEDEENLFIDGFVTGYNKGIVDVSTNQKLPNTLKVTVIQILGIITIVDLLCEGGGLSALLWIGYGVYKLIIE